MAMKCLRYGFKVIEVPTHEYKRQGGISKVNVFKLFHIYIWNLLCGIFVLFNSYGFEFFNFFPLKCENHG